MSPKAYAFFKGEFVPLEEAKVSITTHALHYGTGSFEGIRGNWNAEKETLYIFRLREHYERLSRGCRLLMLDIPYSVDDLCRITVELIERCGYTEDVYIRPLAYKSAEKVANLKLHELESDFCLMTMPFGDYLDTDALRCCTSTWRRPDDRSIPPGFKLTGIYINSILAKTEAVLAGFDEAILLNQEGNVSEGAGENLFAVMDGKVYTPPLGDSVLPGITRN
ncbi:MAG: aminotransferase class IV, partial [Chloroflexi bacterium]|nr:aminotransferase class IV [Chloroflexota bacterium]